MKPRAQYTRNKYNYTIIQWLYTYYIIYNEKLDSNNKVSIILTYYLHINMVFVQNTQQQLRL